MRSWQPERSLRDGLSAVSDSITAQPSPSEWRRAEASREQISAPFRGGGR
jgi:hypothetical protein